MALSISFMLIGRWARRSGNGFAGQFSKDNNMNPAIESNAGSLLDSLMFSLWTSFTETPLCLFPLILLKFM